MGMVNVSVTGSFGVKTNRSFCAEEGGHAFALQRAIKALVDLLPDAIAQDHDCQSKGITPRR